MNPTFLFVAAVFAVLVHLARKTSIRIPWRVAAAFYVIVLVFLFRPMVLDYVAIPVDQLERLPPWEDHPDFEVHNGQTNDVTFQIAPWAHLVRESWKRLEAPLWNHTADGGYPLLANMQSSPFSPYRLVALPLGLGHSLTAEAALRILIALWFAFVFARRFGASEIPAMLTAVSWGLSSAIMVWLHYPLAATLVHFPMVLVAVDLIFEKTSWRRFCFTTLAFVLLLVNGHPESAAHIVTFTAAWTLFRMFRDGWRPTLRPVLGLIGAGLLAILVASPVLLPFFEALPFTRRWFELEVFRDHRGGRFYWGFLMNYVQPEFFGSVANNTAWGPAHAEVIMGWAGVLAVAGFFGWIWIAVRDRLARADATLFLVVTVFLNLVAIHTPWLTKAFESLPLFSMIANGRFRFLFCWTGSLLLGLVVQKAIDGDRKPLLFGLAMTATILIAVFAGYEIAMDPPGDRVLDVSTVTATPSFIVIAIAGIALVARRKQLVLALLVVAVSVELMAFGWRWNTTVSDEYLYPTTPAIDRLRELLDSDDMSPARVAGFSGTLFPNMGGMYGFEDVRAHDPMANVKVIGMLRVFTGYTAESYFGMLTRFDHQLLDFMGVRYVMTPPGLKLTAPGWNLVYEGRDANIYKNDEAMPRFLAPRHTLMEDDPEKRQAMLLEHADWYNESILNRVHSSIIKRAHDDIFGPRPDLLPQTEISILRATPRRYDLEIDAKRWSVITSSLPIYPGWRVWTADGNELPVSEINGGFLGFLVPPGVTNVRVDYRPRSYYNGLWLSALTLLGIGLFPLAGRFRRSAQKGMKSGSS